MNLAFVKRYGQNDLFALVVEFFTMRAVRLAARAWLSVFLINFATRPTLVVVVELLSWAIPVKGWYCRHNSLPFRIETIHYGEQV